MAITLEELLLFSMFVIALISLIDQVNNKKK